MDMRSLPIILSRLPLADAVDALSLDEAVNLLTAEVGGYGMQVQLVRSRGQGGSASVADLPDLDRWELRTRSGEPYIVRVRALDGNDRPVAQAYLSWWGPTADTLRGESVYVVPRHRRMGVASAMYALAERATGFLACPSAFQTPDGKSFWRGSRDPAKAA